ncbi:MAG: hypothetical protein ACFFAN_08860 [Promethearchaeota archaeon]
MELRIENKKLKSQIEDLEQKILTIVGRFQIESSGEGKNKNLLNEKILEFIDTTPDQLNIVSPKIDAFYIEELKKATKRGIPVLLITRDRRLMPDKNYKKNYDELKNIQGISVINNPNVTYLLIFNSEQALYSGGSLDKEEIDNSVLIVTTIKETQSLRKIAKIFSMMLPSFMRV